MEGEKGWVAHTALAFSMLALSVLPSIFVTVKSLTSLDITYTYSRKFQMYARHTKIRQRGDYLYGVIPMSK